MISRPSIQGITMSVFVCMKKYIHWRWRGHQMKSWNSAYADAHLRVIEIIIGISTAARQHSSAVRSAREPSPAQEMAQRSVHQ